RYWEAERRKHVAEYNSYWDIDPRKAVAFLGVQQADIAIGLAKAEQVTFEIGGIVPMVRVTVVEAIVNTLNGLIAEYEYRVGELKLAADSVDQAVSSRALAAKHRESAGKLQANAAAADKTLGKLKADTGKLESELATQTQKRQTLLNQASKLNMDARCLETGCKTAPRPVRTPRPPSGPLG
ncbi:MAG: hypothetical protein HY671_03915, partial [Chloroflexi bacterium]|nr:hypothetical protein [Chloroflexota bacterium]